MSYLELTSNTDPTPPVTTADHYYFPRPSQYETLSIHCVNVLRLYFVFPDDFFKLADLNVWKLNHLEQIPHLH